MRLIFLRALAVILLLLAEMAVAESPNRVTILYDSFGKSPSLTMDWGFAALVEYGGKRILFDTGGGIPTYSPTMLQPGTLTCRSWTSS
jgi:7,8-dihydropterin-6-yl-methyl-4-(beta-D-ribofuranosyl)aminobenzene 5'-phosphate synthase